MSADAATLSGVVKFEGAAPKMANIQMGADPYCASQHPTPQADEEVVVGPAGELANVIVFVKDAPGSYPAPSTPAVLDQQGCQYTPHVSAVQVNQPVEIKNSDSTLHNVHAMPNVNATVQRRPARAGHGLDEEVRQGRDASRSRSSATSTAG